MLLNEKNYYRFKFQGKELLYVDREEIIFSICQYLKYILRYKEGIFLHITHEKQYKNPQGKHAEINPHSLETQKRTDFDNWRENLRGYKGIDKYYVLDFDRTVDKESAFGEGGYLQHFREDYHYTWVFGYQLNFHSYEFLHKQTDNALIGIAFAFLTYLYRYSPLERSTIKHIHRAWSLFIGTIRDWEDEDIGIVSWPSGTEPRNWEMPDWTKIPNKTFYEALQHYEGKGHKRIKEMAYKMFLENKERIRKTKPVYETFDNTGVKEKITMGHGIVNDIFRPRSNDYLEVSHLTDEIFTRKWIQSQTDSESYEDDWKKRKKEKF